MRRPISRTLMLATTLAVVSAACSGQSAPTTEATIISAVDAESTTTTERVVVTTSSTTTLPPAGPALAVEGDKNETVEAIQFLLNCNGYADLTVDGSFGPATLAAVQAAQTALGRTLSTGPDEETFGLLSRTCADARDLTGEAGFTTLVGNVAPDDPDLFKMPLEFGTEVTIRIDSGEGIAVIVKGADGTVVNMADEATWVIETTGDYLIEVSSETETVTYAIVVDIAEDAATMGDWIIATDGITYDDTQIELGDDAETVIEAILEIFGHGVRGRYDEFDTGWYEISDPQVLGLRGIYIEGFAFLFFGPSSAEPARAETLERIRFDGPSDDAEGNPRPENYATTAEGITVGDTLANLKSAYGDTVRAGSNDDEHYYKFTDAGGVLCFYFGASAPTDASVIKEIATECRA